MFENQFDEATIEAVWRKATIVPGWNPHQFRRDQCGATIQRNMHGNRNHKYGWEIDHVDPNGSDGLFNLQPLQWENNVSKSDSLSSNYCVVFA